MHIISASRRTDIPAFHAEWFMNRIRSGFVLVRSPFSSKIFRVSLSQQDVVAIVFWTKDAAPLLPYLDELSDSGHCFTIMYTINNYPAFLEPGVPRRGHTMQVVDTLVKRFSSSVLRWRYDTIVLTERTDRRWHLRNFENLCQALAPYTKECIFSFCDYYRKTVKNMSLSAPDYRVPDQHECIEIAQEMGHIARKWGIELDSCAHDFLVSDLIGKARCIDSDFLAGVVDTTERKAALQALKTVPTRPECGCAESKDIGAYNTCAHGCLYCYANADFGLARHNLSLMDPDDSCLDPRGAGTWFQQ